MRALATTLTVLLLVSLAGCDRVGQDPIVGKWEVAGGNVWSEYFPDGTAIFNDGSMSLSGNWQRLEDGRLKIETIFLGISVADVYRVEIRGDDVTFTNSSGKVEHYRRAEEQ